MCVSAGGGVGRTSKSGGTIGATMSTTYKAILRGDRVEWLGDVPETNGGVTVEITVVNEAGASDVEAKRRAVAEALESLASRNTYAAEAVDPVEWQREIRKDRPLPGREE